MAVVGAWLLVPWWEEDAGGAKQSLGSLEPFQYHRPHMASGDLPKLPLTAYLWGAERPGGKCQLEEPQHQHLPRVSSVCLLTELHRAPAGNPGIPWHIQHTYAECGDGRVGAGSSLRSLPSVAL